jgi:hypothetical protein
VAPAPGRKPVFHARDDFTPGMQNQDNALNLSQVLSRPWTAAGGQVASTAVNGSRMR